MAEGGWKDHPGIVAFGLVSGTLAICISVFTTVVIPTYTTRLQNKLDAANANVTTLADALKAATAQQAAAAQKQSDQATDIETLRRQVRSLRIDRLFSSSDVYPSGLRAIRIGDDVTKVAAVYGAAAALDRPNNLWNSVRVRDSLFGQVVYYKVACGKTERVYHILFLLEHDGDRRILEEKAMETYGAAALKAVTDQYERHNIEIRPVHGVTAEIQDSGLHITSARFACE